MANHFSLLVLCVALSGSSIVVYLRRRALRWEEEGLCPRCGSSMTEGPSAEGGQVCARCSSAERTRAIVVLWLLLAGSLAMGMLLVGIVVDRASDSRPTSWGALIPFVVVELYLVQGTVAACGSGQASARKGVRRPDRPAFPMAT